MDPKEQANQSVPGTNLGEGPGPVSGEGSPDLGTDQFGNGIGTAAPPDASAQSERGEPSARRSPWPKWLEQRSAQAMGENIEWWEAQRSVLLRQHPEWYDQWLVVSSRTPSKILAVSAERMQAIETACQAPEALEVSRREGLDPGFFLTAFRLDPNWVFDR